MSWRATAKVKEIREGIDRTEKFLLLILADYHNDETGQCDPSVPRLADDALMDPRTAQLALRRLHAKGFIRIEERVGTSNQYWLICLSDIDGGGENISPLGGDPWIRGGVKKLRGRGDPPIRGGVITGSPKPQSNRNKEPKGEPQRARARRAAPSPADLARQLRLRGA